MVLSLGFVIILPELFESKFEKVSPAKGDEIKSAVKDDSTNLLYWYVPLPDFDVAIKDPNSFESELIVTEPELAISPFTVNPPSLVIVIAALFTMVKSFDAADVELTVTVVH